MVSEVGFDICLTLRSIARPIPDLNQRPDERGQTSNDSYDSGKSFNAAVRRWYWSRKGKFRWTINPTLVNGLSLFFRRFEHMSVRFQRRMIQTLRLPDFGRAIHPSLVSK